MQNVDKDFVYDKHIEIEVDGVVVLGRICKLTKYYIEVEIVYPFANWTNHLTISGAGRMSPNNFYKRYNEVSERLLKNTYEMIAIIDSCIDRASNVYGDLQEEIAALTIIENSELKDRMESKLRHWFFDYFLASETNKDIVISIFDEEIISTILETYRNTKQKIYQVNTNPFENNKA